VLVTVILSVPMGIIRLKQNKWQDYSIMFLATLLVTVRDSSWRPS
jgi:ABC-type dipeptide/oligopeptide/nickel transport system permease component